MKCLACILICLIFPINFVASTLQASAPPASVVWHVDVLRSTTSVKSTFGEVNPVISEEYIAWVELTFETFEKRAHVFDRRTKQTHDLTSAFDCQIDRLDITNDWLILEYRCPQSLTAIGAYNIVTGERVEISPVDPTALAVLPTADDNKVVWLRQTAMQDDLYAFDFESREITQLTNDTRVETYPDLSGDWVVWADFPAYDIYAYNLATGERIAITNDLARQNFPRIDSDLVVWDDFRNGEIDVYGYDLNTRTEIPIAIGPGYQQLGYPSGNLVSYLTFSYDAEFNLQNSMIRALNLGDGTDSLVYEFADDETPTAARHHYGDMIWYYELPEIFTENGLKQATRLTNRTWLPIAFSK